MCGIAGLFSYDKNLKPEQLNAFSKALAHRGPDDFGFWGGNLGHPFSRSHDSQAFNKNQLSFIHRRLSILDLTENGWQPMVSHSGRYTVCFNGEIYNFIELRKQLESPEFTFKSRSDTEVIAEALDKWGLDCFNKFEGMFAIAIYDKQTEELIFVRDFFGIKPLYYSFNDHNLAFASEITPLIETPWIGKKPNPNRIFNYLRYNQSDDGSETFFENIFQVPPGHLIRFKLTNKITPQIFRYWKIERKRQTDLNFHEASDILRDLFLSSVERHMRSDVPVGVTLSGGIDSSAVTLAAAKLFPDSQINTFSFIPNVASLSEEKWVDLVASTSKNLVCHKSRMDDSEFANDLPQFLAAQDLPVGSTSVYAQYKVFELIKKHNIKVVLDGQGADEIFAGYHHYLSAWAVDMIKHGNLGKLKSLLLSPKSSQIKRDVIFRSLGLLIPSGLQSIGRKIVAKPMVPYWMNSSWVKNNHVKSHYAETSLRAQNDLFMQLEDGISTTSLPMLLRYEDRNSMFFSIESRVPFLTPQMVQFAFSLPEDFLISQHGESKTIFRYAMRGIVPDEILNRKDKMGFPTPERNWLLKSREWVTSILNSEAAKSLRVFNHKKILSDWEKIQKSPKNFDFRLWRWLNLIHWSAKHNVQF